ncbi:MULTISPECIES: hypothetical protein [Pseudomonas]|uniref:hypothetical protein n=1 Tax=Pseudomonas TaxID=286 RepID=UPI000AA2776F|nr:MULTISPECIES: hypothetical protein [Pseudomonas]WHS53020.1 hypothetical protein QLH64_22205 [Pseudomonas brassicacearum]
MELERIARAGGGNDLWGYEWDLTKKPPAKYNRVYLGVEQPLMLISNAFYANEAVSWAFGRTLGNIATTNPNVLLRFPGSSGVDEILECEIVDAGLYRNGKSRFWCRTHQKHWGTLADIEDAASSGATRCAQWSQPMSYVANPYELRPSNHAEVGIWCSLPPALTNYGTPPQRRPRIHVHVRDSIEGRKVIDQDFDALAVVVDPKFHLFAPSSINKIHITPPAVSDFMLALEHGIPVTCFNCTHCGSPHLDLGVFNQKPHKKHLCGNCGRDSTWTYVPSTSTPLYPLHRCYNKGYGYIDSTKHLNIDEFGGCEFSLWASTPAIMWSAARPQERGIHVHLSVDGRRIIDDTFGSVVYRGAYLCRDEMLGSMMNNTVWS